MSLLLQALQKAAKTRAEGDVAESFDAPASSELALEPAPSAPRPASAAATSSPAQAAAVVQAGRVPAFDAMDYAREHYMATFIGAATLFAVCYGTYVYIQVKTPFRSAVPPLLVAGPSTPTITVANASTVPSGAKISGMPGAQSSDDRARPQKAAVVTDGAAPAATEPSSLAAPSALGSTGIVIKPYAKAAATKQDLPSHGASMPQQGTIEPVALTDASDSIETVVIPASRSKVPSNISVQRDSAGVIPVSPALVQAYEALQRGEIAHAKELYGQVLQADPRNIDAFLGLAAIASSDGRTNDASRYYQQILELDPRNSYAQAGLISIVGGADLQASETRLKQLIMRDPSAFLYFSLGNLYAEQRQWPAAQQAYYQAYQMQQDNPDYAFNLAIGLEHIGQNRLALDYYRKALDLSFKKGHANFDQSLVIQRVGQLSTRIEQ